jgi:hypothetical protein
VCKCDDQPHPDGQKLPNYASVSPASALASCLRSVLISDVFILRSKSSPACSPPSPATASSSASFVCPRRSMSSSIEFRVISFTTSTSRFCPIRYARSCACLSLCGLKSWSKLFGSFRHRRPNKIIPTHRMTTLAAVKLMPMPPALVDKRKQGIDSFSLNSSTRDCRTSTAVEPVNNRYLIFCILKTACKISRTWVNCTPGMSVLRSNNSKECPPARKSTCVGPRPGIPLAVVKVLEPCPPGGSISRPARTFGSTGRG